MLLGSLIDIQVNLSLEGAWGFYTSLSVLFVFLATSIIFAYRKESKWLAIAFAFFTMLLLAALACWLIIRVDGSDLASFLRGPIGVSVAAISIFKLLTLKRFNKITYHAY